jgi:hypothetical protein
MLTDRVRELHKACFGSRNGSTARPPDVAGELRVEHDWAVRLIEEYEADGPVARI